MARNKSWFRMAKKSNDLAEIEIFDEIDPFWGVGAKEFKARLDEVRDAKSIRLLLNSPGGSVFEGLAIYNILKDVRAKLDVEVVGLAASIASVVAQAGKTLVMGEGSYYMIHNPWTLMVGGASDLRSTADLLDKIKGDLVGIYATNSGLSEDEIAAMMDEETWLGAAEAVEKGFASGMADYGDVAARAASFPISRYKFNHAPTALADASASQSISTIRDFEGFLRDSGFSKPEAVALASQGWKAMERGEPDFMETRGEPAPKSGIKPSLLIAEIEVNEGVI